MINILFGCGSAALGDMKSVLDPHSRPVSRSPRAGPPVSSAAPDRSSAGPPGRSRGQPIRSGPVRTGPLGAGGLVLSGAEQNSEATSRRAHVAK